MRAVERAAGGGVARAVVLEDAAIALLDLDRGMVRQEPLHPAVERDLGGGEGIVLAASAERALQAVHGFGAQRRDRDRKLGGFVLDGVEPMRIGRGSSSSRLRERSARSSALTRPDARRRPPAPADRESAAAPTPARRTAGPSPASARPPADGRRRRPPSRPARGRCGIARMRPVASRRGRLDAGAERGEAEHAFDLRRRPPRTPSPSENATSSSVARRRPAAGHQERDRLDQVGLAGAVRPGEHDEAPADVEARRVVAAEVGQRQAADRAAVMAVRF